MERTRIKERAALLADKAKQIWPFPDMTAAELTPYQTVEKLAERYSIESYDTNVFTKHCLKLWTVESRIYLLT